MKVRLLKRLKRQSKDFATLYSHSKTNGIHSGLSYGYNLDEYAGLSNATSEKDFYQRLFYRYMELNIDRLRFKYKKVKKSH